MLRPSLHDAPTPSRKRLLGVLERRLDQLAIRSLMARWRARSHLGLMARWGTRRGQCPSPMSMRSRCDPSLAMFALPCDLTAHIGWRRPLPFHPSPTLSSLPLSCDECSYFPFRASDVATPSFVIATKLLLLSCLDVATDPFVPSTKLPFLSRH
ncbi:uncharacterized protein SCHCODRAFT_02330600 [Schizophyllum commune H4-8]|uniref:uncharacterized protein n=1 Tax=Schizophyllum commune (strain H4-8 / FGSC 9210) TaxID=578458 RepID=UPI00215FFAF3|nr:uncharacterized protein SCHCODRAFT_02330600 [Schizophyllum commune H4-8]KAI5891856.1 hypothetical protein SCHCODRAFT_02330600 [Schizophyllum commune H4-8]